MNIREPFVNVEKRFLEVFVTVSLIAFLFSFAACEDDGANSIGLEGIDTDGFAGNIKTDTLYVEDMVRDTSFMDSVTTGKSDRWYLGSVDNYDFRIAMRFTMPQEVESVTVTGATLQLVTSAAYGASGSFTANIHAFKKDWTLDDLRWNRLTGAGDYGDIIAQGTINHTAEAGNYMTINLPKDTIQHWVWSLNDTNRAKLNNGIMIDFSGANFVQQFYGPNNLNAFGIPDTNIVPRLDISYQKYDPVTQKITVDHVILTPVNTSNGYYTQGISGYVFQDRALQPANTLTVGGAVPYHSLMHFNTSKIPGNATINLATLIMKLDPSGNYQYSSGDSLLLQALRVNSLDWQSGTLAVANLDRAFVDPLSRYRKRLTDNVKDDSLTFNISRQFQEWVTFPSQNFGLQISHADEVFGNFNKLYRVRFINNPLDRENSPKIIIFYTLPPEN